MRASEIQPNKLVIFDIDDTLVHTQTKVHVVKDGQVIHSLNSHDFTHYKLQPGESFDFGDFANAEEFFTNARPIIPMMHQLKQDIATGNKVVMVTARADFNDRELFLDTFRKYGVDMSQVHVYRAGNMTGKMQTEEKKKIIIRRLLDQGNHSKAIMYDDAVPNLVSFIELKSEYPDTKFYAWHVSPEGKASEYARTNEDISRRGFLGGLAGAAAGVAATDAEAGKKKPADKNVQAMNTKIDSKYQLAPGEDLPALSNNPRVEIAVQKAARAHGITNPAELAQFMAQTNHESWDFTKLYQVGDKRIYGGKGLIQLTGKQNYAAASKAAGVDLVRNPDEAAKLSTAIKVAIWFWKEEVRRYAKSPAQFMDTQLITRIVNGPSMNGLRDRDEKFKRYLSIL
jgi:predicted chitinase